VSADDAHESTRSRRGLSKKLGKAVVMVIKQITYECSFIVEAICSL